MYRHTCFGYIFRYLYVQIHVCVYIPDACMHVHVHVYISSLPCLFFAMESGVLELCFVPPPYVALSYRHCCLFVMAP